MRSATGILRREHEVILSLLEVVDALAAALARGGVPTDPRRVTETVDLLRTYADRAHHGKEEDGLFPALERKGIRREGGPLAVMSQEHEQGRDLLRQMSVASVGVQHDTAGAGLRWARAASAYTELLRSHIFKENNILFAMAERALSAAEQEELAEEFDRIERERLAAMTSADIRAAVNRLRGQLGLPAAA